MKRTKPAGATAPTMMTARQLEVRYARGVDVPCTDTLRTSRALADVLRPIMEGRVQEALIVLHLDARHRLIGWEETAKGAMNVVHVCPRDIFRSAIAVGAAVICVAHNHPSGDPTPSTDDVALTNRLRTAAEIVGVPLIDHLILADEGFFSFTDGRITRLPRWTPTR